MASTSAESDGLFPLEFVNRLERALALEVAYTERAPLSFEQDAAQAAVLALFARSRVASSPASSGISLLVTRRADSVQSHRGQMAFPGGRCEPDELTRDRRDITALRETEEEVGIPREDVKIVGQLPPLCTITKYWVTPFVGLLQRPLEDVVLQVSADEIAETIWVPWEVLTHPETYRREMIERGAIRFPTHVYQIGPHRIWGATGSMIKNLLDRFDALG